MLPKTVSKDDNFLSFTKCQEKYINKIYKKLVDSNSMSEETWRHLKYMGTKHGIIYGFVKKAVKGVLLTVCSSDYFIYFTNTYIKSCKDFRVPILQSLTSIRYAESNT